MTATAQRKYIDEPYEKRMTTKVRYDMIEFNRVYKALYDSENLEDIIDNSWLWDELIEKAENFMKTKEWKEYIKYWHKNWGDFITSDRELKALAIALYL